MNEKIIFILKTNGMENIRDFGYYFTCDYNSNHIMITKTIDNKYFSLSINYKQVATKCLFNTIIKKIKLYNK